MPSKTKNKLNHILEAHTWLAPYHIIENGEKDFTIRFENENDADRFSLIVELHGGTIKDSGYIN